MNLVFDDFMICTCGGKMVAVGEDVIQSWESVYIYICLDCNHSYRSTNRYEKSFSKELLNKLEQKWKRENKEKVVFT